MAATEGKSLSFWYRDRYKLTLNDPRYLATSEEEIAFEYEAYLASRGEELKTCPRCGSQTHRNHCTRCVVNDRPLALTGDTQGDDIHARLEAGEELDLDALFRKENFVPVSKEGK